MRIALFVLLLAGCAQTMHLYPRGGGQPIIGELRTAEKTMAVPLDGETYAGSFMGARSTSIGSAVAFSGSRTAFGAGTSTAYGNTYAGLLVSPSGKTMRCEFMGAVLEEGNGVCQHGDGRIFDLLLKP